MRSRFILFTNVVFENNKCHGADAYFFISFEVPFVLIRLTKMDDRQIQLFVGIFSLLDS